MNYLSSIEASSESIAFAEEILKWIASERLIIDSVDSDALGGVDIYLTGIIDREAWFCILDSGERSIVLSDSSHVIGFIYNESALQRTKEFLRGK